MAKEALIRDALTRDSYFLDISLLVP
jgi:hypothetical protein